MPIYFNNKVPSITTWKALFFAQEVKLHLYLLPQPLHPQMMNWLSSSSAPSIALVITGIFSS